MDARAERTSAILGGVIALVCALGILGLHCNGTSSRRPPIAAAASRPYIVYAKSAKELFATWRDSGAHGQKLVQLSRFFHFIALDDKRAHERGRSLPVRVFDLVEDYEQRVDSKNVLWVALQRGLVRELHHVLQPAELDRRIEGIGPNTPGVRVHGRKILAPEYGTPRVGSDELPILDEPFVLSIDASYLDSEEAGPRLLERLRPIMPHVALLTLCRSDDNRDVTEAERRRMDWLAQQLGATTP